MNLVVYDLGVWTLGCVVLQLKTTPALELAFSIWVGESGVYEL